MKTTGRTSLGLALCGALGACGGGSGDETDASSGPGAPAAALAVPAGDAGAPAAEVATDVLVRNAGRHARDGLAVNLAAADALLEGIDAGSAASALAVAGVGPAVLDAFAERAPDAGAFVAGWFDDAGPEPGTAPFADGAGTAGATGDGTLDLLIAHTLGDGVAAAARRDGDRIAIDPDEGALCAALHSEWYHDESDRADCRALYGDVGVTIDAVAESAGIVTWSFREEAVLRAAYAPGGADYELRLAGLAGWLRAVAALDGEPDPVPPTFEGTLRLTATVLEAAEGRESGRASVGIGEPLRIADPALGTRLELAPSTLLALSGDAATGDVGVEVALGALDARIGIGPDDGLVSPTVIGLSHGGLVLELARDGATGSVELARYGLPAAPLAWSIDGDTVARLAFPVSSARIGPDGGDLTLTSRAAPTVEGFGPPGSGERMTIGFDAPAGTRLVERPSGDLEVRAGGPVTIRTERVRADGGVERGESSIVAGQCVGDDGTDLAGQPPSGRACR